jgi:hypothetical protein
MRSTPCVTTLLALFALAACGSSVTKEQADQVCNNLTASQILGTDGVAFARKDLEKTFGLSTPDASEVLRQAVKDYCPEHQRQLGAAG